MWFKQSIFSGIFKFKWIWKFTDIFGTATDLGDVSLEMNRLIEKSTGEKECEEEGETDEEGRGGPCSTQSMV